MNILHLHTLHLIGAFALFTSLGSILLAGSKAKSASVLHGISLLIILLIGFVMLKKPPTDHYWWMAKLGLWLFLSLTPALAKRKVLPAPVLLLLSIAAAACAAWLGYTKPF